MPSESSPTRFPPGQARDVLHLLFYTVAGSLWGTRYGDRRSEIRQSCPHLANLPPDEERLPINVVVSHHIIADLSEELLTKCYEWFLFLESSNEVNCLRVEATRTPTDIVDKLMLLAQLRDIRVDVLEDVIQGVVRAWRVHGFLQVRVKSPDDSLIKARLELLQASN